MIAYQQKLSDWDKAREMGQRAFYEHSTNTIRAYPENYCLAYGGPGNWKSYDDAGAREWWPAIRVAIATWASGSTSEALAKEISKVIPRYKKT